MDDELIVAVSGYAQAGKDTLAKFFLEDWDYTRFAFADALRDSIYALNPLIVIEWAEGEDVARLQEVVDEKGWERAKLEHPEIRRLLQAMGTEAGRKVLGENIWVETVFNQVQARNVKRVIITDCRFPNEAQAVKANGGFVVRVERPGVEPVNAHPSETALDEWGFDYRVLNDGSLEELHSKAKNLHDELLFMKAHLNTLPSVRLPGYGSPFAKAE